MIKVFVNVLQNAQAILNLVEFVAVMERLTKMNVNLKRRRVSNRNRYKLSIRDLVMNAIVRIMLNAKKTSNLQKVSDVFVLRRVQKRKIKFVVVMEELILTDMFWKESLVCLR